MNKAWLHIFDNGACLSRRQIKDYVGGAMISEECHAIEVHLNSCEYCADAMTGITAGKGAERVDAMMALNRDFLAERFGISHPEVHLNSIASAASVAHGTRRRGKFIARPIKSAPVLLVLLVLGIGLLWYANRGNRDAAQLAPVYDAGAVEKTDAVDIIKSAPVAEEPIIKAEAKPTIKTSAGKAKSQKPQLKTVQAKNTLLISNTPEPKASADIQKEKITDVPDNAAPKAAAPVLADSLVSE